MAIVEAGRLDPASLFARFGFTRDALQSAAEKWVAAKRSGTAPKPGELKTFVHELTHYVQYTTTPYGLFLHYCRILQNRATIGIVNALLKAGCPVRQPLLYRLPDMPADVARDVWGWLAMWVNTEDLVTALNGDHSGRRALAEWFVADFDNVRAGGKWMRPPLLGVREAFVKVQESLADYIAWANAGAADRGNPVPMYPGNTDSAAIAAEASAWPTESDAGFERMDVMLGLLGDDAWADPLDVSTIIESSASAAEFWESDVSYHTFTAWVNADVEPRLARYRTCLREGLEVIGTRDLPSFLATYQALCEIALSPPLLPQHAAMRMERPGFVQLIPWLRFRHLLSAAQTVTPMSSLQDHDRYRRDICQSLGWVHPVQITASAMKGPRQVSDPRSFIYLQAQRWRAQQGSASFLGIDRYLVDSSPLAWQWRQLFDFVIIDYQDRTTYHTDKNFLKSVTTGYLNMLALQAVMLGQNLTLRAPYSNDPAEKQWMTDWLRQQFRAIFGRDFPDLRIV